MIPALSYLLHESAQIFKDWKWDEATHKWIQKVPFGNQNLATLVGNLVPGALNDPELGTQLLLTTYHVNGFGCLHQSQRDGFAHIEPGPHGNRYATDVANYLALKQIISPEAIAEMFDMSPNS